MRDATLRQLQIFASAARHLSFSRASAELHLTQPAVSMQIKQLEHYAGLPLFERLGRRLQLTAAGAALLPYAQVVLHALQDAEDAFASMRGLKSGRITIGAVGTAKYFAPRLLALFSAVHPEVELKLLVNNRDAVVELLRRNEVDLALMGTPPRGLEATATSFAKHPLVIVAPPDHRLAGKRRLRVGALGRDTFLIREQGSGTRAAMEQFFAEHGLRPAGTTEISSNETIKQAVMAGLGVAFISHHTVGLELATKQLTLIHLAGLPVIRNWNVVHLDRKQLSPAAAAFKEFVLREGAAFLKHWPQG